MCGGTIISAVTVAGKWGNDRLGAGGSVRSGHSSCSADLHLEQRWRSRRESPDGGHSGGRDPESKCSCLSNAAHSITGTAHLTVQHYGDS